MKVFCLSLHPSVLDSMSTWLHTIVAHKNITPHTHNCVHLSKYQSLFCEYFICTLMFVAVILAESVSARVCLCVFWWVTTDAAASSSGATLADNSSVPPPTLPTILPHTGWQHFKAAFTNSNSFIRVVQTFKHLNVNPAKVRKNMYLLYVLCHHCISVTYKEYKDW